MYKKWTGFLIIVMFVTVLIPCSVKADTFLAAQEISVGQTPGVTATIGYEDTTRWYFFKTSHQPAFYYIDAENTSTAISRILFSLKKDSSSGSISYVHVSNGDKKSTRPVKLEPDTVYYVKLNASMIGKQMQDYNFRVLSIADDAADQPKDAKPVRMNEEVKGTTDTVDDEDYYSFCSSIEGCYKVQFTNDSLKSKSIGIYDRNQKLVNSFSAKAGTSDIRDDFNLAAASLYYIKVSSGDVGSYSFKIIEPKDDCGNTTASAKKVKSGKKINGMIDYKKDIDFYKIQTGKYKDYRIAIGNKSEKYLNVKLYDKDNIAQQMGLSYVKGQAKGETCLELKKNSTYYLSVNGAYEGAGYYIFCKPLKDDYGNTCKKAKMVKRGKKYTGVISNAADEDWFGFKPSKSMYYTIQVKTKDSYSVEYVLYQKDKKGGIRRLRNISSGSVVELKKGRTYYIQVRTDSQYKMYRYALQIS